MKEDVYKRQVKEYLAKYPSSKVVLDVHRDAVQRDSTLVKPITQINGKKAAQMMIIAGCDDGTMEMPNWGKNLRFAAGIQEDVYKRQGYTKMVYPFLCHKFTLPYVGHNQQRRCLFHCGGKPVEPSFR